jgi:hypothetical protein
METSRIHRAARLAQPILSRSGLALCIALLLCGPARADRSTEQIALAASGRFDELEKQL